MPSVGIARVPEKPFDEEIYEAVRKAVDMLGGPGSFARPAATVLIKPNWYRWPSTSPQEQKHQKYATTDRRVVLGAARLFVDLGCKVLIGEDPAVNVPVAKMYQGFKAQELARRAGAELIDLRAAGYRTVPVPSGRVFKELRISSVALDADLIVNLPLMKAHMLTAVTLSLKNMKGIIPPVEKRAFHQRNLSQGVADLATVIKPGLNIVDAIVASDNWVIGGGLRPMGLIIAGDDPVSTDAVCCHIMQADPYQIDHLRAASEMGVGEIDLDQIEVLGEDISELSVPFKLPADPLAIAAQLENIEVLVGQACSGCLNRLGEVFTSIGSESLAQSGDLTFVVGKDIEPVAGRTNILVGVCTARHEEEGIYLPYCPPMSADVAQAVRYAKGEVTELLSYWDDVEIET